jgi:hypothetical protein
VDRFGTWEDDVYPPTMRVLQACFPGVDWTRWEKVRPRRGGGATAAPGDRTLFGAGVLAKKPIAEGVANKPKPTTRKEATKRQQASLFAPHPDDEEMNDDASTD